MDKPSIPEATPAHSAAKPPKEMSTEWRRWVAENVLLNKEPNSIIAAMVRDGIDPTHATVEVHAALVHPYIKAARQLAQPVAKPPESSEIETRLKKRDWVLECYRRSARQATGYGTVPRVRTPSRKDFLDSFYAANQPVVIEGAMDDWRAITAWTSSEFKRRLGARIVEVQANRTSDNNYERNSTNLRRTMPFAEYVDKVETAGSSNDFYITAKNSGTNADALKELWEDVVLFPEYLRDEGSNNGGFFWFGPQGTVTPLHHDLTNNFMAQVRGKKSVRLIAPYDLPRVYNDRHCYSQVDLEKPDFARFPLLKDVTIIDAIIGPRNLLFVPVGWWHHVRALEISITMTFTNFVFDNDFYSFYSA